MKITAISPIDIDPEFLLSTPGFGHTLLSLQQLAHTASVVYKANIFCSERMCMLLNKVTTSSAQIVDTTELLSSANAHYPGFDIILRIESDATDTHQHQPFEVCSSEFGFLARCLINCASLGPDFHFIRYVPQLQTCAIFQRNAFSALSKLAQFRENLKA